MNIEVNFLAIFLAAVASMMLGFFWYSKTFLGVPWMKLKGFTEAQLKKEQDKMGPMYGLSFVVALLTAYILSHLITFSLSFYGYPLVQTGLTSAFFAWLGFVMPVQVTATIFGEGKWKLFAIDTGYQLVSLILMSLVLTYFG